MGKYRSWFEVSRYRCKLSSTNTDLLKYSNADRNEFCKLADWFLRIRPCCWPSVSSTILFRLPRFDEASRWVADSADMTPFTVAIASLLKSCAGEGA